jgi:hypothetical protein
LDVLAGLHGFWVNAKRQDAVLAGWNLSRLARVAFCGEKA